MITLAQVYRYEIPISKAWTRVIAVLTVISAMILGAYIRIPLPFTPVPITLQTFFVILGAAVLGRKYAAYAMVGYISLGALGLPVFQGYGSGLLHIFGPTGGYLVGFVVASVVIGMLLDNPRENISFGWVVFSTALGQLVIYAFGVLWISLLLKINLYKAVYLGFIPFIPGALFKLMTASLLYSRVGVKIRNSIS